MSTLPNFNHDQAFPPTGITSMPVQAIPSRKKDKKWKEANMDALEAIGLQQMRENMRFADFYRMKENKISYMEMKDVMPYLDKIGGYLRENNIEIPSFIKHYDLIGTIVNAYIGWLTNISSKYTVNGMDDIEVNDYQDTKEMLLQDYLKQSWNIKLNQKLVAAGLDPDLQDFESEEQRQQYIKQVNAAKTSMTPPEIETWMNTKWKSAAAFWGDQTLKEDRSRFHIDEIDEDNFTDYLLTGRMFRHYFVGYDYYSVEAWSPLNTFYSKSLNARYPQYGDYVGRVHYFTSGQIISRYGHLLTAKQKQEIIGGLEGYQYSASGGVEDHRGKKASIAGLYGSRYVPWAGYDDYMSLTGVEDYTGMPTGIRTSLDEHGNEVQQPAFLPRFKTSGGINRASWIAGTNDVRQDMYQVTEGYWVSYRRVLLVTYVTSSGLVDQKLVTDDLLEDFLKENDIKKITGTIHDDKSDPEINTYIEEYVPQGWKGVKISGGNLKQKSLYIGIEPLEHQIPNNSNMYDFCLPVCGYIGESLADKIQPWQILYNLSINQCRNNMEKEVGVFFATDPTLFPDEYREWYKEDGKTAMNTVMELARDTGIMPIDMPKSMASFNNQASNFNQFKVYDMSLTSNIKTRIEVAEFARQKAMEQVGITPQALGAPLNYQTSTGVKQGAEASFVQTQIYFNHFDYFNRRALDLHLAVAQRCQKDGRDWTVMYTKSDLSKAFLRISDDQILLRQLGVHVVSDSRQRLKLENFRQYLLNMNTTGSDILDFARILESESMVELRQVALDARRRQDQIRQQDYQAQQQTIQMQAQADQQKAAQEHEYKIAEIDRKGEWDVRGDYVVASGRAADSKADTQSMKFINDAAQNALKEKISDSEIKFKEKELESTDNAKKEELRLKGEELRLKAQQLRQRQQDNQTKRFTSIINN